MITIHKKRLSINYDSINDKQVIELPFNSKILSVSNQSGYLTVWYLYNTEVSGFESRTFYVYQTGQPLPERITNIPFVGTVALGNHCDLSVYHVFEGELV